jgi:hypothetical protein
VGNGHTVLVGDLFCTVCAYVKQPEGKSCKLCKRETSPEREKLTSPKRKRERPTYAISPAEIFVRCSVCYAPRTMNKRQFESRYTIETYKCKSCGRTHNYGRKS